MSAITSIAATRSESSRPDAPARLAARDRSAYPPGIRIRSPPVPIGIDDFRTVRESGLEYVDKSDLIREIVDRPGVQVMLLPRPRRFGKTLNLSMLRCWFEKSDTDGKVVRVRSAAE